MEVKWIKIVTDIFDDEKIRLIEKMPDGDKILVCWFKLLCLAGKQNNHGVLTINNMPYTDEMLAAIFNRSVSTVRKAIQTFEAYGMVERIDGTITIPNWDKHQTLDAYERRKEADRARKQRQRATQCGLVRGMSADTSANVHTVDKDKDIDRDNKEKYVKREEGADIGNLRNSGAGRDIHYTND